MGNKTNMKADNVIRFDWAAKYMLRDKSSFVILEGFLSALLNEEVKIMELLESESNRKNRDAKSNRVDIKTTDSKGEIFLVEIQQATEYEFLQRILFSVSKTIVEHIPSGHDYSEVKKVYSINILYFNLGQGSDYLYHGRHELRGVNTGDTLVVSMKDRSGIHMVGPENVFPEYYLLRMSQFNDEHPTTPLGEWMRYFKWGYIDPKTKEPALRKAWYRLNVLKMSPEERKAYEYDLYNKVYEEDVVDTAKHEGLVIGEQRGLAEGHKAGLAEGEKKAKMEMAKRMLAKGMPLGDILELTGLSLEEWVEK